MIFCTAAFYKVVLWKVLHKFIWIWPDLSTHLKLLIVVWVDSETGDKTVDH